MREETALTGKAPGRGRGAARLAVLAGACALAFFQVCDPDTFWHLKVGETILATGRLVRTNVFAAAFPDHPWYNPEWLFQLGLALAHRWGGWAGVAALKLLLVGLLSLALVELLLRRCDRPLPAAGVALAALAVIRFRLTERPQLLSLLFFTVVLLCVADARRGRPRTLGWVPAVFLVWANTHTELLLGLLYLAGAATGAWMQRKREDAAPGLPRRLALTTLASTGVAAVNPDGFRVLTHPFPHFKQDEVVVVREFIFSDPRMIPLFWLFLAALLLLLLRRPRARRDWSELLPLAGLVILGIRYIREVPYAVLAAAPLLTAVLPGLAAGEGRRAARFAERAAGALLVAGCLAWAFRFERLMDYRWGWGVNSRAFPVAAADAVEKGNLPPALYNSYDDGAYLIYRLFPRLGVFQDSRLSAYPEEFMGRLHARYAGLDWASYLAGFQVNTALVFNAEGLWRFPASQWGVVFWDDRYTVFVRRGEGTRALLERLEYRRFLPERPLPPGGGDRGALVALLAEMQRNAAERSEPSAAVLTGIGQTLAELKRTAEARQALLQAVELAPREAAGWLHLGLVEFARGQRPAGKAALAEALRLDPRLTWVKPWLADPAAAAP